MLKLLLGAAACLLAIGVFVGLGFAAHDGGRIPYQDGAYESGI